MDKKNKQTKRAGSLPVKTKPSIVPLGAKTGIEVIDSLDLIELRIRKDFLQNPRLRKAYQQRLKALTDEEAKMMTDKIREIRQRQKVARQQRRLETRGARKSTIFSESLVGEMNIGSAMHDAEFENVNDHAGEEADSYVIGQPLHETENGIQTQYELSKFFERPISIYDAQWAPETEYFEYLSIWELWSNNPAIRAKLSNYAYFKGNLHLRISVSGTPFHYGRLMFSYYPYHDYNSTLVGYKDAVVIYGNAVYPPYKAYLSQALEACFIDVKENKPLEMTCNFVSYKQNFRLFNSADTVITNAVPFYDFTEAGELVISTLNQIRVANADVDSEFSINIYAWVTDIELGCITGTNIDITAESSVRKRPDNKKKTKKKKPPPPPSSSEEESSEEETQWQVEERSRKSNWEKKKEGKPMYEKGVSFGQRMLNSVEKGLSPEHDEYNEPGPVATVASAVAGVAGKLTEIPVIGGFAKATTTIASGLGKVASWFGWAKPLILEKPSFVKNMPFTNGAVLTGNETSYKLACDPKQEVTVDPSIGGGTGEDEMTILSLSSKESFLTTFEWSSVNVAMSDILWYTFVTPTLCTGCGVNPVSPATEAWLTQPTPMMFAVQPFAWWHGRIKFRFEVVCSKFHRGKLLFRYEPNVAQYSLITSSDVQLNQMNTTIVDIQDTQEIEFTVDWAFARTWAGVPELTGAAYPPSLLPDTDLLPPDLANFAIDELNGYFEVRCINELVEPSADSSVYINVFVSCDDLQVAVPASFGIPTNRLFSESLTREVINSTGATEKTIYMDHFGEHIVSFRSLLKRFLTVSYFEGISDVSSDGVQSYINVVLPNFLPTVNPIGLLGVEPNPDSNYVRNSLLGYLQQAYLGFRGGMRYRFINSDSNVYKPNSIYTRVSLLPPNSMTFYTEGITCQEVTNITGLDGGTTNNALALLEGTATFDIGTNGGIEYEIPYYTNNLFNFSCSNTQGVAETTDYDMGYNLWFSNYHMVTQQYALTTDEMKNFVQVDAAIAEDFTFIRFLGAPFYVYSN